MACRSPGRSGRTAAAARGEPARQDGGRDGRPPGPRLRARPRQGLPRRSGQVAAQPGTAAAPVATADGGRDGARTRRHGARGRQRTRLLQPVHRPRRARRSPPPRRSAGRDAPRRPGARGGDRQRVIRPGRRLLPALRRRTVRRGAPRDDAGRGPGPGRMHRRGAARPAARWTPGDRRDPARQRLHRARLPAGPPRAPRVLLRGPARDRVAVRGDVSIGRRARGASRGGGPAAAAG